MISDLAATTATGPPGAVTALAAIMVTLALCLVPGYGLVRLSLPRLGRLRAVAVGPAVSAGVFYVVGELLSLLGVPVNLWLGLVALGVGTVTLVVAERRARAQAGRVPWTRGRLLLPGATALSSIVGAVIWAAGIGSLAAVPPHHDGFHHGYFVARIVNLGTLDPSVVMATDVLTRSPDSAYYPFALHMQAAMVVQAVNIDVASAFTLVSLITLLVALPAGMVVICSRIFPDRPLVAAVSGVVAVLAPGLTYSTSWWGGYAMAAGLAVSLGALELLLTLRRGVMLAGVPITALAVTGVAGVHTSEMPLLASMATFLAASMAVGPRRLLDASQRVVVVATPFVVALVLLAPAIQQMAGGYEERQYPVAAVSVPLSQSLAEVFSLLVFVPPPTPAAMVLGFWGGLIAALILRQALSWALLWMTFAVLYVWLWSYPSLLVTKLTAFWYSDPFRLAYILVFLAIPFVAFAFGAPLEALRRRVATKENMKRSTFRARLRLTPPALVLGGIGSLVLLTVLAITCVVSSVSTLRTNYDDFSLMGKDEREAFRFLAENSGAGERVVNQYQDGSPWMYSLYGVAPLIPIKSEDSTVWDDRLYLLRHAPLMDVDARVDELVRRYAVRYVYVNEGLFANDERELSVRDMQRAPAFRQVFRSGNAYVFEKYSS